MARELSEFYAEFEKLNKLRLVFRQTENWSPSGSIFKLTELERLTELNSEMFYFREMFHFRELKISERICKVTDRSLFVRKISGFQQI